MILIPDAALRPLVDAATREDLALLLDTEVEYLDRGRYPEWLNLFAEDGIYWMPLEPDQPDPLDHVSLFYEDRMAMQLRIRRISHPRAHSLVPPVRTSHVCGTAVLEHLDRDTGEWVLSRRFQMTESQGDRMRNFAGLFTYTVRRTGPGLRIGMKRVDLVNPGSAFETIQVYI